MSTHSPPLPLATEGPARHRSTACPGQRFCSGFRVPAPCGPPPGSARTTQEPRMPQRFTLRAQGSGFKRSAHLLQEAPAQHRSTACRTVLYVQGSGGPRAPPPGSARARRQYWRRPRAARRPCPPPRPPQPAGSARGVSAPPAGPPLSCGGPPSPAARPRAAAASAASLAGAPCACVRMKPVVGSHSMTDEAAVLVNTPSLARGENSSSDRAGYLWHQMRYLH